MDSIKKRLQTFPDAFLPYGLKYFQPISKLPEYIKNKSIITENPRLYTNWRKSIIRITFL